MALSVQRNLTGPAWPLGFVKVTTIGTAVCIMTNVDANNGNSPQTGTAPPVNNNSYEFTPTFRGLSIYGIKPGSGNNGMIPNNGNIYLLCAPQGSGPGNRSDSGAMLGVIGPGQTFFYPPEASMRDQFSGYTLYIDADNNNDGALIVGWSPQGA